MPVLRPPGLQSGRLSRRQLLGSLAVTGAAGALLPRTARASVAPADRKFLFVQALGGWDITQVFAPIFGSEAVYLDEGSTLGTAGALEFTDHPERPSVPAFFERWGDRTALVHGMYIASIAHPSAIRLLLSGSLDAAADWGTRIAAAASTNPVLPHLVVGGIYYAGAYGVHVGRAGSNGQLQTLASGDILALSDQAVTAPSSTLSGAVDDWLAGAVERARVRSTTTIRARKLGAHAQALERAVRVKGMTGELSLESDETFAAQAEVAVAALQTGVSRVVTLSHPGRDDQVAWDSHAINQTTQSGLFESLFADLGDLLDLMAITPGTVGDTLADETIVVVLSEFSRTPTLNGSNGRDHWPCTSALVVGPGIAGGRMVGAYDDDMYGRPVDLASAEAHDDGIWLGPEHLGATLLALADVDPAAEGVAGDPIAGMLA